MTIFVHTIPANSYRTSYGHWYTNWSFLLRVHAYPRARTRAHIRARAHTRARARAHRRAHTHKHTRAHTCARTYACAYTHARAHANICAHAHANTILSVSYEASRIHTARPRSWLGSLSVTFRSLSVLCGPFSANYCHIKTSRQ